MDPDLPIDVIVRLSDIVNRTTADRRFLTLVTTMLGTLGFATVVLGLLGSLSKLGEVSARDIAIRAAVGASRHHLIAALLRRAMTPVLIGAIGGLIVAHILVTLLRSTVVFADAGPGWAIAAVMGAMVGVPLVLSVLMAVRVTSLSVARVLQSL